MWSLRACQDRLKSRAACSGHPIRAACSSSAALAEAAWADVDAWFVGPPDAGALLYADISASTRSLSPEHVLYLAAQPKS